MSETISDEIDLLELVEIIWDGKWQIIGITAIFALLAIVFVLMNNQSYDGQLRISKLDRSQIAAFAPLNDTPGISKPIYSNVTLIGQEGVILSADLFKVVQEEFSLGEILIDAHQALDPRIQGFEGDAAAKRDELLKIASDYKFALKKGSETEGFLEFATPDKALSGRILQHAVAALNDRIRTKNLRALTDLKASISTGLRYEIEETQVAIENVVADYQIRTKARLANLKEQAAIARQLSIAGNQSALGAREGGGIGINVNSDLPLYLRGYKALETEAKLIEARGDDVLPYIDKYPDLAAKLQRLESDKRLQRIDTGIALTPLADPEAFRAANVNVETIVYQPSSSRALVVIMATLLGGIIATLIILFRHFIGQRRIAA